MLLVSVIGVNNEIGTIQDIKAIADAAHEAGAFIHSDCAQAPLATSMSNIAQHVDMLSLSSHKMYGPKGIGVLFIDRSIQSQISPIIFGGGQQQNLRSGTVPTPLIVGMGEAATLLGDDEASADRDRLRCLRDQLVTCLKRTCIEMAMITPNDVGTHPANANVRFVGVSAHDILQSIQPHVAASTGSACTSGSPEPSHVLRAIGLTEQEAEECIRFSVGRDTTQGDVEQAAKIISEAIAELSDLTRSAPK